MNVYSKLTLYLYFHLVFTGIFQHLVPLHVLPCSQKFVQLTYLLPGRRVGLTVSALNANILLRSLFP